MENRDTFHYTYSAAQRSEIENIRRKYLPPQEDKMAQLRKLDRQPARKAKTAAITVGVIGMLILGTGMSGIMTEMGALMGKYAMPVGIVIGIAGLVLIALAYPIYSRILKAERTKIAPEVLRLSDALMDGQL